MRTILALFTLLVATSIASAQCGVAAVAAFQTPFVVQPTVLLAPTPVAFVNTGFVGANVAFVGRRNAVAAFGGNVAVVGRGRFRGASVAAVGAGASFQQIQERRGILGRVRSRTITQVSGAGGANFAAVGGRR